MLDTVRMTVGSQSMGDLQAEFRTLDTTLDAVDLSVAAS